jgi:hypothetical protein
MADAIVLTISPASAPFVITAPSSTPINLQLGATLVGPVSLTGPSSLKGISVFVAGQPQPNEILIASLAPYSYSINEGDCAAVALHSATAQTIFTIKKTHASVTTTIGTITFAIGSALGIIDITSSSVAKGDLITGHAPSVADATLADIAFLLAE